MSCASCGDCCEAIPFGLSPAEMVQFLRGKHLGGRARASLEFIAGNWVVAARDRTRPQWRYQCAAFDTETRQCLAHDVRPPVCSDYPAYPKMGKIDSTPEVRFPHCGYWAAFPPAARPAGSRPLIPVMVL